MLPRIVSPFLRPGRIPRAVGGGFLGATVWPSRWFRGSRGSWSHDNPLGIPPGPRASRSTRGSLASGLAPSIPRMQRGLPEKNPIPNVRRVVLVSSAKGGVGKSTTAVNLALALNQQGQRVGILDADIFGPSLPKLMNLQNAPEITEEGGRFRPLVNYGVECMSMGFLVGDDAPIVWRGLMVMKAIQQLLYQIAWSPLDTLVIDMPPGTGDVQLSISQLVPISGAVIITTPQELSLQDARRGIRMFQKVHIPIIGVVQNMSYYVCPNCHYESHVFGQSATAQMADKMAIPLLVQIPLEAAICHGADEGVPVVTSHPDGTHAQVYHRLARSVLQALDSANVDDRK